MPQPTAQRRIASSIVVAFLLFALPAAAGINRWTPVGPDGGTVLALAQDPVQPKTLYAGSDGGGVFRSLDRGHSWTESSRGLSGREVFVQALAVDPQTPATVYAGTAGGIAKSTDGGATWSELAGFLNVHTLAIDPRDPAVLYAGPQGEGVWKSSDGGATWQPMRAGFENVDPQSIAVDPFVSGTVYATFTGRGQTGVYKSTDGGATWLRSDDGLPRRPFQSPYLRIAVDPTLPGVLYVALAAAGSPGAVFRSADRGATWTVTAARGAFPFAVGHHGEIYAGAGFSLNGGASFTLIRVLPDVVAVFPDILFNTIAFAATRYHAVERSNNHGIGWSAASLGLHATRVTALAADPSIAARVYAWIVGIGLVRSERMGDVWQQLAADPGLGLAAPFQLAVDPQHPAVLFAAYTDRLGKSTDGGATFRPLSLPDAACQIFHGLAIDPASPSTLYAGGEASAIRCDQGCHTYRSSDSGAHWSCMTLPALTAIAVSPARPSTVYAATPTGLSRSLDRGATWTAIDADLPVATGGVGAIGLDPNDPDRLYASTFAGVFRSDDGGATWIGAATPLPHGLASAIAVDPRDPRIVYAGLPAVFDPGSVYRSEDGGITWLPANGNLTTGSFTGQLVLAPKAPDTLYAGTAGGGVQRFTRVEP